MFGLLFGVVICPLPFPVFTSPEEENDVGSVAAPPQEVNPAILKTAIIFS
ncbi:hypothetical protein [uncultured Brachyspira sp.]